MEKNDIGIIHGTEYRAMTKKLLEWADLAGMIGSKDKKEKTNGTVKNQ